MTTLKTLTASYNRLSQFIGAVRSTPRFADSRRAADLAIVDRVAVELRSLLDAGARKSSGTASMVLLSESLLDQAAELAYRHTATTDHNAWARSRCPSCDDPVQPGEPCHGCQGTENALPAAGYSKATEREWNERAIDRRVDRRLREALHREVFGDPAEKAAEMLRPGRELARFADDMAQRDARITREDEELEAKAYEATA